MASTFGGIVAYVSSAIDMSESVSVIEKIEEDNEKRDKESIFAGSHWQWTSEALDFPPQQSQFIISTITLNYMWILSFIKVRKLYLMNIRTLEIQVCLGSSIRMHEYAHTYIHIGTHSYTVHIHISLLVHLEGKFLISSQTITKSINPFFSTEIALHGIMQYTTWLALSNIPRG